MQPFDGLHQVCFRHHDAEIEQRCALGDHAHVHVWDRSENPGRDTWNRANVLTHQTDDRLAPLVLYIAELGQVCGHCGNGIVRIDSERNADFRGGHHVHRAAMSIEDFKDGAQEPMSQ